MGTWHRRFDKLATFLDTDPSKADILRAVDAMFDEAHAYRTETMSDHVSGVVRQVIAEHLWTEDPEPVEPVNRT